MQIGQVLNPQVPPVGLVTDQCGNVRRQDSADAAAGGAQSDGCAAWRCREHFGRVRVHAGHGARDAEFACRKNYKFIQLLTSS